MADAKNPSNQYIVYNTLTANSGTYNYTQNLTNYKRAIVQYTLGGTDRYEAIVSVNPNVTHNLQAGSVDTYKGTYYTRNIIIDTDKFVLSQGYYYRNNGTTGQYDGIKVISIEGLITV